MTDILKGAFIECYKIKNKQATSKFLIKLSEIKLMEEWDDNVTVFSTFKDCSYVVEIPIRDLTRIINMFIFKPEEYSDIYVPW